MFLQNSIARTLTRNVDRFKLQSYKQILIFNLVSVYLFIFNNNNLSMQCLIYMFMQF